MERDLLTTLAWIVQIYIIFWFAFVFEGVVFALGFIAFVAGAIWKRKILQSFGIGFAISAVILFLATLYVLFYVPLSVQRSYL